MASQYTSRYIKLTPPPGGKFVRDWKDKRVRLNAPAANGTISLPAGAAGVVLWTSPGRGISVRFDTCPHCGAQPVMSGLRSEDVEVIE